MIEPGRSSENSILLFRYIERHPIIDIPRTAKALNLSYNTVASLVGKFEDLGILVKKTNKARNRVYEYARYLDILRKGT